MTLCGNLVHLGGLTSHRMVLHRPVNLFLCHLSIADIKISEIKKSRVKKSNLGLRLISADSGPIIDVTLLISGQLQPSDWSNLSLLCHSLSPVQMPRFRDASKNDPRYAQPSTIAASITCPLFCAVVCEVEEGKNENANEHTGWLTH